MKSPLRVGLCFGFCLLAYNVLSIAASGDHPEFDKRLADVGLAYSLPSGFVDNGANVALEKELNQKSDSASPFVVHQIRSADERIAAYMDIRVLGIDLTNRALSFSYPIVFEANAEKYCATISGSPCSILTQFSPQALLTDYHADLGTALEADQPDPTRIGGHKKARVLAISKPARGLFYTTIVYDSDLDLDKSYKALTHMLKFK